MVLPADIRPRIQRILAGGRRTDDLHRLFEWLRFRTGGLYPTIRDIGDFGAHRDTRNVGHVWETGKDFCYALAWHMEEGLKDGTKDLELLAKAVWASFRGVSAAKARATFGVGQIRVKRALATALKKIERFEGRDLFVQEKFTPLEEAAFEFFRQCISIRLAMTQASMMDEFVACLGREGALLISEIDDFVEVGDWVAAYVVTLMHQTELIDGAKVIGHLNVDLQKDHIAVCVTVALGWASHAAHIFTTTARVEGCCDPTLLAARYDVTEAIDLDERGKLGVLR